MKRLTVLLLLTFTCKAHAQDGAGRDLSVALFSAIDVKTVSVRAAANGAWFALCSTCAHQPLTGEKHLPAARELYLGGAINVRDLASGAERTANGQWHLRRAADGAIDVVLTLPSERYIAGVVNAEASADSPPQALQALSIVARTYALHGRRYKAQPGHLPADLCDSTQCQDLRLGNVRDAIRDAVRATAGETLWSNNTRADVYFSQACGGSTEDVHAAWPASPPRSYLQSHHDPYCLRRNTARWHAEIPLHALQQVAVREHWSLPQSISAANVLHRSISGRVQYFELRSDASSAKVSASSFRFGIGRALGWNRVRSDWYDMAVRNGNLVLDGRGFGHGVGLCQFGVDQMAAEGRSARDILAFYFPGTTIGITSHDSGWVQTVSSPLTIRSVHSVASMQNDLLIAYSEARRRFPTHSVVRPTIVVAPSTEIFRQLTSQPGWALAATSGSTTVFQPDAVLRHSGMPPRVLFRHEMLHALIESESRSNTPLWLREGLVEYLTRDEVQHVPPPRIEEVEASLHASQSLQDSQRAHENAGESVRLLVERYGLSAVRSWLVSGVPVSAVQAAMTAKR